MASPSRAIDPIGVTPNGIVEVPGSKSHTNRALLIAALADGKSRLRGALVADDTKAMAACLEQLGAKVKLDESTKVKGLGGRLPEGEVELDAGQSGTTARFLLPVLAVGPGRYLLDGDKQLRARPIGDLVEALRSRGARIEELGEPGCLPLGIEGRPLAFGALEVESGASSQFASGLMIAAPLAEGLDLSLLGRSVSRPYIEMTAATMRSFGVDATVDGDSATVAEGSYESAKLDIEPDASAATYFWALAAATRGDVTVPGLGLSSTQGDVRFARVLEEMGAHVEVTEDHVRVRGGELHGIEVNLADISDTVPTLAAIAPFCDRATTIDGVGFIRAKESDRIGRMVEGLHTVGIGAEPLEDGMRIEPGAPRRATIETHDDHRLAMAFSILGLCGSGVDLDDAACVAKTYPGFFDDLVRLRRDSAAAVIPIEGTVVAIDGPAGSGKSTVARQVADRLGLAYLDTGAMYRAVAFAALRARLDPDDADGVGALVDTMELVLEEGAVVVNGVDATVEIRGPEVTQAVSAVAAIPAVRSELRSRQREWVRQHDGGVLEGRDIGTVVIPDATCKVYLTARESVRAARRAAEVEALDYDKVAADIAARDAADAERRDSPLPTPDDLGSDVWVIDTSYMSIDDVVTAITEAVADER